MSEKTISREKMFDICHAPKWGMALLWTLALAALGVFAVGSVTQAAHLQARPSPVVNFQSIVPEVVAPGETVLYTVRLRNSTSPVADGYLVITLPVHLMADTVVGTPGLVRNDNVVTWTLTNIGTTYVPFTLSVQSVVSSALHEQIVLAATCFLSNADGNRSATAYSNNHYFVGPTIGKSLITSVDTPINGPLEAAAGEIVTTTAVFEIPANTVAYNVHPYVLLEDGLKAGSSDPTWISVAVGTPAQLGGSPIFDDGTLISFEPIAVITGPKMITYTAVATRTRDLFVPVSPTEIPNATQLSFQPILRWCDYDGCAEWITSTVYVAHSSTTAPNVEANRPIVDSQIAYQYQDSAGVGAGGAPVLLTISHRNNTGRVSAYDNVLTVTLSLTYVNATPTPAAVITNGVTTLVVWDLPTIDPSSTWVEYVSVQALLPTSFEIGTSIPALSTQVYQESFAGDVPYEGGYLSGDASLSLMPGVAHSKSSTPAPSSYIKMGQEILYTVVLTQGANTILTMPVYTDTLPLGFHLTESLSIEGATLAYSDVVAGPGEQENIVWGMETLPLSGNARVVTATYRALNTGLNNSGEHVYATGSNLTSSGLNVNNSAVLFWQGASPGSLQAAQVILRIIQPFMGNSSYFLTNRVDSGPKEIGDTIQLRTRFRNTTNATNGDAYDVQICDQLPKGFGLFGGIAPAYAPAAGCSDSAFIATPSPGDNLVCWTINRVCRANADYTILYYATIDETVLPGASLSNYVYIQDYTSMSGTVAAERHYNEIPVALPTPARCGTPGCVVVNGLAVSKRAWQTDVVPGEWLTYTIAYSDTSGITNYTNVVITDTYDASLLSFVSATPAPVSSVAGVLVWNVGSLTNNNGQIVLTMRVANTIPDGVNNLVNTLLWDSDQTTPHQISRTVPLRFANVNVAMTGPAHTHADDSVTYTVIYSNTGSAPATINLNLTYNSNMSYVDSLVPPVSGDNVFEFANVPNDGMNHALDVQLHVKTPLPYTLAGPLVTSVTATSPGAAVKSAQASTILDRPVLKLRKEGPPVAPGEGQLMQFEIYVTNQGTYTATNLVFTDTWGANLSSRDSNYQSHGWTVGDGTYLTRELAQLGVGEEAGPFYFDATVDHVVTYYTNTVGLSTYQTTQQSVTEYVWQASIETTKVANPDPAFPGRLLTYTISYTNTGAAVLNARITDTLPSGFVYVGHSEVGGTGCTPSWTFVSPGSSGGGNALWGCPAMAAGASGSLQIWGTVQVATEGQDLINTTSAKGDEIPFRPIFEPVVTRSARPWLRVDAAADPAHPMAPGDEMTYILTYENYGTDPAYNVVIADQLPAQVEFLGCSGGDSCLYDSGGVTWNLAEVGVDEVGTVQVVVRIRSNVVGQTAVNSNYSIQSRRLSVAETMSGPSISTPILNPHVSLTKTVDPLVVMTANGFLTYTVTYMNDGGGDLPGVVITDNIDARLEALSVSPASDCVIMGNIASQVVTCDFGVVPQGESASLTVWARVTAAASDGDLIPNVAGVRSDKTSMLLTDEAVVAYAPTGCIPPVGLDFTTTPHPRVGKSTTFTASVLYGNTPINYTWILESGAPGASGVVVSYTYAVSNTYSVMVIAGNTCKSGVTKVKNVSVWDLPEAALDPTSLSKQSQLGSTVVLTDLLVVANTGTSLMSWSVTVAPETASWLSVSAASTAATTYLPDQTTPPQGTTLVTAHFDPTGLAVGSHTATLEFTTNDPDHPQFSVPVTFVIIDRYEIYLPLVVRGS
ncbi:MAG: DUF11 domain-containing protein [Anaerolineae bacterium]|nr:DUF11 domain-containing protein [Anaerolineae bacterium]